MNPLEEIYPNRFFSRRNSLNWRAKFVCEAVRDVLAPVSVIDVGCAIGDLVKRFLALGIDAYGLEGSRGCLPYLEVESDRVFIEDLRLPIDVGRYDLAICFEVAEHIEPEYADQFLANLTGMSDRVLMSAAPPFQGGHYHVNCQPQEYWTEKMAALGFAPDTGIVEAIKQRLAPWQNKPGIKAYYQNLLYFERAQ